MRLLFEFMAFVAWVVRWNETTARWDRIASRLGLRRHPGHRLDRRFLTGTVDGADVWVEELERRSGVVQITVEDPAIDARVTFRRRDVLRTLIGADGNEAVETGDPGFDDQCVVEGPEATARALLDMECRSRLRRFVGELKGSFDTHAMRVDSRDIGDVVAVVPDLLALARALRPPDDGVAARLARNATRDVEAGVRLRCLGTLQRRFAADPRTTEATRRALRDQHPRVRLLAASALGAEATEAVDVIAAVAAGDCIDEEVRVEAIGILADRGSLERAAQAIRKALTAASVSVRLAAIDAATRLGHREALPRLLEMARASADEDVAAAAIDAVMALGDARAEAVLVPLLGSGPTPVKTAVARTLGAVGTVRSVEPLLAHTEGLFTDGELKRAARDAVARIQARLGPAQRGSLALAPSGTDEGALSLAGDGGTLSLAPDEADPSPPAPAAGPRDDDDRRPPRRP